LIPSSFNTKRRKYPICWSAVGSHQSKESSNLPINPGTSFQEQYAERDFGMPYFFRHELSTKQAFRFRSGIIRRKPVKQDISMVNPVEHSSQLDTNTFNFSGNTVWAGAPKVAELLMI